MNKATVKFVLPSGVMCEATELYGEHHEILTKQGNSTNRITELLESLIISVGSVRKPDAAFIDAMRSEDRRHILATVRQATMDYEKEFEFTHKYVDVDGNNLEEKLKVNLTDVTADEYEAKIQLLIEKYGEEGEQFYRDLNRDGTFFARPAAERNTEYADLPSHYETVLPKSGQKVRISHLTGKGEKMGATADRKTLSRNTLLKMRFPQYYNDNGQWIHLDVKKLHAKDIEHLFKLAVSKEGEVEMELRFNNPDKTSSDKMVTVDLLSELAFFFPSEVLK